MSETWTNDGERFIHVDYDDRDVAEVTREALRWLLERAGFTEAESPDRPPPTRRDGRIRLRAANATTPPTDAAEAAGGADHE